MSRTLISEVLVPAEEVSMRGLLLLLPLTAFAGQSLVLTPGATLSVADPNLPQNQSWRVEFQLHDWTLPPQGIQNAYDFYLLGTGLNAAIWPDGRLALTDLRDSGSPAQPCFLSLTGRQNVLVRFQRDVPNMRVACEIWNSDGTGYQQDGISITAINPWSSSGGTLGSPNTNTALAFLRVFSTTLPNGARPPVTADVGDLVNLTFNSGSTVGIAASGPNISYAPTPGQNPVAFVKTFGAPAWNNWVSLRAGFPAQLDGSRSFSLADGSSAVTYQWVQVSGPTTVSWSDTTSATPTIQGLIFGTYTFQLTVKDIAGNKASTTLQIGAVATDANGVVVQADPNADKLFGPMIAFGQNPWGYADERALTATTLRSAAYDAAGLTNPTWATPLPGTITYKFWAPNTILAAAISAGAMSIQVSDPSQLDLTEFPTRILLGNAPFEEISICSATGNTLQVCYDGRGWRSGGSANGYHFAASAWASGTRVYQSKMKGTGTQFMTNFCPAGRGWSGLISYQDGTVTVTPGSSSLIGNGTSWANTNAGGRAVRIQGTHNGGIPFVFHAYVAAVNGATSLALVRPWPSDADSGTFKYTLLDADTRNVTPHYTRSDGSDSIIYFLTSGCESDTALYPYLWWDNGITGLQTNVQYSYMDGFGYNTDYGVNYYDEVLAHYALYYRSGWTPARDAARKLGDNWLDYPEIANGDAGGAPRRMSVTGVVANTVLDGRTKNWTGLRTFANRGVAAIGEDCNTDTRENAYELSWLAFAALFDPVDTGSPTDPNQRSYWKSKLAAAAARDTTCGGSDHSWKTGFYWDPNQYPALTVTNGSAVATGSNLAASMCPYIANGAGFATANSAVISGSGFQAGQKIVITGTRLGQPYTGDFEFRADSSSQVTLSVLWPGDAGPITWMIEGNEVTEYFTTIATDNISDPRFGQIWACRLDNPSQITLNRPWVGNGTETVHLFRYNLVGRGVQPFMLGIKTSQMHWGSLIDDAATATSYRDLASGAANWIATQGYDPLLKAISYGRIFPMCEPPLTESGDPTFGFRIPGCIENSANPDAVSTARARNSEVQNAIRVGYQANPTADAKAQGDQMYCAQWGNPTMTQPGYCTSSITASNLLDYNMAQYKWPGFFFGMGMAHEWPAVRVGGVSPPIPQSVPVNLDLSKAASARVTVTQPSSATSQFVCSSSPCQVVVDARQGAHWAQVDYLSSNGQVLSSAPSYLLPTSGVSVTDTGVPTVTPSTITLNPSQSVQFTASFGTTSGPVSPSKFKRTANAPATSGVNWSINPAVGSISSGGVYTAPNSTSQTSMVTVTATSVANPNESANGLIFLVSSATPVTANPSFNPAPRTYSSPQSVTISTTTAGASIRYTTDGSTPSSTVGTLYVNPVSVSSNLTLKAIAYKSGMTDSAVTSASYVITTSGSNTAVFVNTDTVTQGTWQGTYGADGYNVIDDTVSYPGYVTVTPAAQSNYTWANSTSDVRGLQKALTADRIAATWYSFGTFTIDLNFSDSAQHQLAVYCVDWDSGGGRTQTVNILDGATNAVLDTQNLTNFQNGKYLVWKLRGHVILRVTNTGPINATISGLFFDPAANGTGGTTTVATPTFNPPAGAYSSTQSVTISTTTGGALIRYTTDGSTPTSAAGTVYSGPVSVSSNMTLKAIAYESGMTDSAVASGNYTIQNIQPPAQVVTPSFNPPAGTYGSPQFVTINTTTAGASIRYTTDGSTPTSSTGIPYFSPVNLNSSMTLTAIAYKAGMTDSVVASASYTIQNGKVNGQVITPMFNPPAGTYGSAVVVAINTTTAGASIHYTTDGSTPTSSTGIPYSGPVSVSSSMTLRAIAYESGMADSMVVSGNYTVPTTQAQVAAPAFNPPAGSYSSTQSVAINTTTAGASIRYTTDGSTPTSSTGIPYSGPVNVSSSMTLKAIAYKAGMTDSTVASASYAIQTIQVAAQAVMPVFNPPAGAYSSAQLVAIGTITAGASIRYTTDGSTPTSSTGIPYSGPVNVNSSMTLKAIAYKAGMTDSIVASGGYTIQTIQAAAQVATPAFNPPGGTFSSTQPVAISTSTAGASIRYTTDGSTPTSSTGIPYSGPVNVSSSMTLKAIAYESGMIDSSVNASTYAISSATTGGPAWYNSMWSNRMAITIDHTKVSGPGNLINFAMLFSVTDPNLRTVANGGKVGKSDGTDIMFTASDGVSKLDHELESFSASTGQVNAWVRLASLSPTADTVIYVYYGNVYAADQQNKTSVWDNNYRLVWHLGNGTVLSGADSTNMGNNGVAYGGAGAGKIGGGAAGMVEAVSTALPSGDETRTLECWFQITANTGSDQAICGMGRNSGQGTTFSFLYSPAGSTIYLDSSGATQSFPFTNDSNWHHLAASYSRGLGLQNAAVYLDGVLKSTMGQNGTLTTSSPTYVDVHHNPASPQNEMAGVVDEFRISTMARSAGWILTEYNNQNSPNTFFSVGGQQ